MNIFQNENPFAKLSMRKIRFLHGCGPEVWVFLATVILYVEKSANKSFKFFAAASIEIRKKLYTASILDQSMIFLVRGMWTTFSARKEDHRFQGITRKSHWQEYFYWSLKSWSVKTKIHNFTGSNRISTYPSSIYLSLNTNSFYA